MEAKTKDFLIEQTVKKHFNRSGSNVSFGNKQASVHALSVMTNLGKDKSK